MRFSIAYEKGYPLFSLKHNFSILTEHGRNALAVVRTTNRLAHDGRHVDDFDLAIALRRLFRVANRIRDHELLDLSPCNQVNGTAREQAMRRNGKDALGARRLQRLGRQSQRTARINHVVHEDGRLASYITDKQLHLGVHIVCRRVVTRGRFAGAPAAQTATALVGDEPLAALAQRVHTIGNFTR